MKYKDPITGEYKELFLKASDTLPIGAIVPYGSDDIPTNWLLCDGSAVSRTTYASLFSVIGTNFGEGDGETTFNLPDFRSTIPSLVTNYIIKSGMSVGVLGNVVNEKTDSSKDTYSCDYINEINTYSTEEQVIGTWMGKPLYRKILDLGNVSFILGVNDFNHNISNLDVLTSFNIKAYFSDQNSWYTWWSAYGTMRIDKTQLHITSSAATVFSQVYVVVEYTKTTDIIEE